MEAKQLKEMSNLCRLQATPGWPDIDNTSDALCKLANIVTDYAVEDPPAGSLESKLPLIVSKYSRVLKRQASAAHHLCVLLSELQRKGSSDLKRELATAIAERLEDYQRLENELTAALLDFNE